MGQTHGAEWDECCGLLARAAQSLATYYYVLTLDRQHMCYVMKINIGETYQKFVSYNKTIIYLTTTDINICNTYQLVLTLT